MKFQLVITVGTLEKSWSITYTYVQYIQVTTGQMRIYETEVAYLRFLALLFITITVYYYSLHLPLNFFLSNFHKITRISSQSAEKLLFKFDSRFLIQTRMFFYSDVTIRSHSNFWNSDIICYHRSHNSNCANFKENTYNA